MVKKTIHRKYLTWNPNYDIIYIDYIEFNIVQSDCILEISTPEKQLTGWRKRIQNKLQLMKKTAYQF